MCKQIEGKSEISPSSTAGPGWGREADISVDAADIAHTGGVLLRKRRLACLPGRNYGLVRRAGLSKITQTLVSSVAQH